MGFFGFGSSGGGSSSNRHSSSSRPHSTGGVAWGSSPSRHSGGYKIDGPFPSDRSDIDSMHGGRRKSQRHENYSPAHGWMKNAGSSAAPKEYHRSSKHESRAPPSSYKAPPSSYIKRDGAAQTNFGSKRRDSGSSFGSWFSPGAHPSRAAETGRSAYEDIKKPSRRYSTSYNPSASSSKSWATSGHVSNFTDGYSSENKGDCRKCGKRTRRLISGKCESCALGPNKTNSVRAPTPPNKSSRYSGTDYGVSDWGARKDSNARKEKDRSMRENTSHNANNGGSFRGLFGLGTPTTPSRRKSISYADGTKDYDPYAKKPSRRGSNSFGSSGGSGFGSSSPESRSRSKTWESSRESSKPPPLSSSSSWRRSSRSSGYGIDLSHYGVSSSRSKHPPSSYNMGGGFSSGGGGGGSSSRRKERPLSGTRGAW